MELNDELIDTGGDARTGMAADMHDLVGIMAIALSLHQDGELQHELRRCARVRDDRTLVIQLPVGGAGMELLPRGGTRALRRDTLRGAVSLERLIVENPTVQDRLRAKGSRVFEAAQALVRPFFLPGALPSRAAYEKLERWSPLIERIAYRMCARSVTELDSWRPSASREVTAGSFQKDSVLGKYYALNHTIAHLTLLCSNVEARPWLVDMARSFEWVRWTPTFSLIRERTMWLAAAAARSVSIFGAGVADLYLKALAESSHVLKAFDALFGLTAIALSDEDAIDSILEDVTRQAVAARGRQIVGARLADVAFRSAIAVMHLPEGACGAARGVDGRARLATRIQRGTRDRRSLPRRSHGRGCRWRNDRVCGAAGHIDGATGARLPVAPEGSITSDDGGNGRDLPTRVGGR